MLKIQKLKHFVKLMTSISHYAHRSIFCSDTGICKPSKVSRGWTQNAETKIHCKNTSGNIKPSAKRRGVSKSQITQICIHNLETDHSLLLHIVCAYYFKAYNETLKTGEKKYMVQFINLLKSHASGLLNQLPWRSFLISVNTCLLPNIAVSY